MRADDPTMQRLEEQISWYDTKSIQNQRTFKRIKIVQIVAAALVPLFAGLDLTAYATGGLGVLIVILEGIQQLNQYQQNWITYRSTCEALRHEKYLYLANAGPYADTSRARAELAERIEGLISQEHAKWVSTRREAAQRSDSAPRTG